MGLGFRGWGLEDQVFCGEALMLKGFGAYGVGPSGFFWGLGSIYKQKNNPENINSIFTFFNIQKMDTLQQVCLLYKMEQITLKMKNSGGFSENL